MKIANNTLAEMAYESAMYKLYNLDNLMTVRRIWDEIEIAEPKEEDEMADVLTSIPKPKLTKRFT